jgi:hypothetical protein
MREAIYLAETGTVKLPNLAGTGSRYVRSDANGLLSASAGVFKVVATKTLDYTLTSSDEVVVFTGSANKTFTLPDASGSGQTFYICSQATGGASLTIALNTGDSIDGLTSGFVLYAGQSLTVCDYADEKWVEL